MKKHPTPKELFAKRVTKHNFMKVVLHEKDTCEHKDVPLNIIDIRRTPYKKRDREVEDHGPHNPFEVPKNERIFARKAIKRKTKSVPSIMSEVKTICDIDSTFYKIIEGRPLRKLDDINIYQMNIRDITLFRTNAAFLKQQIIQTTNSYTYELNKYNEILDLYENTKANFVLFAKQSYEKATNAQKLAAEKALELENITDELESLSFQYVKVRNIVAFLGVNFDVLSSYRQFLYSVSPHSWRVKYDPEFSKRSVRFGVFATDIESASTESLDMLKSNVALIMKEQPHLYFKTPEELMQVYHDITQQCLNYMQIEVFASNITSSVLRNKDYFKVNLKSEAEKIQEFTDVLKQNVEYLEQREFVFKTAFDKLLMNQFEKLYASYDAIKLFTCVQYVNNKVFKDPEDPKDNIATLMRQLENLYLSLNLDLDQLDLATVTAAQKEMFAKDRKIMNMAYKAQRALKECDILTKALYGSFEPPRHKSRLFKNKS